MTTLPYSGKPIDTLLHISDIHIRLFKRHHEYMKVFENLYTFIDEWVKNNPTKTPCIVITGDVVHSKTDMSPEMISVTSMFFKNLCSKLPVILIAGNHDLSVRNKNRLDALTPIVENIACKNFHYLLNAGNYFLSNVNFSTMSILDDKSSWPRPDSGAQYNVALFHGPVYNAKTDVGYVITSRHVEIEEFDGYDFVLLGDIHRYQTLQYPNIDKPLVSYAGSLVQQNHGEDVSGHGVVVWDLENRKNVLHEIENPYGYATIRLTKGERFKLPQLPDNVRLRIIADNVDSVRIKKVLTTIREKHNILESSVTRVVNAVNTAQTGVIGSLDLNDLDVQNKLLKEYITKNYPHLSKESIKTIIEINTTLNQSISDDDIPKNIHWRPIELKFDNLFSYGKGNVISFESLQGVCGIFSANATGKSSSMDALCFALYDKTPRAFKGDHILNSRESECSCEFTFEVNGVIYKVVRTGSRKKNGSVKIDVDFQMQTPTGMWESLNGEDRRATNLIIRSFVGDYDDFILTNLSTQGQNSLFIDKGQSDRKDLTGRFMGLSIFDKLWDSAIGDSKELQSMMKRFNKIDFAEELFQNSANIEKTQKLYDNATVEYSSLKNEISNLQDVINNLHKTIRPIELLDIDNLTDEKTIVENDIRVIKSNIDGLEINLNKSIQASEDIAARISLLPDFDTIIKMCKLYNSNLTQVTKLQYEVKEVSNHIGQLNKKIHWLADHEYDENCVYCVNNIFMKDAEESKNLISADEEKLHTLQKTIDELVSTNEKLKIYVTNKELYQELVDAQKAEQLKQVNIKNRIDADTNKLVYKENTLQTIVDNIKLYKLNDTIIEENKAITKSITNKQVVLDSLLEQESKLNKQLQVLFGELQVLKNKQTELNNNIKEAENLQHSYEAYQTYIRAMSRDGIPYQLISKSIPTIQSKINNILAQMVDFHVVLDVDGKNINGKIVYSDERSWPLELASGMERFITGLAIRVSLMNTSSLPKSNFLVLDEGLGVLDGDNLSQVFMLFELLKQEYDFIILISHLDVVRDIADTLIDIRRENGYSYINA